MCAYVLACVHVCVCVCVCVCACLSAYVCDISKEYVMIDLFIPFIVFLTQIN